MQRDGFDGVGWLETEHPAVEPQLGLLSADDVGGLSEADGGLLAVEPPRELATHFAYAVLGPLLDEALFHPSRPPAPAAVERHARDAARRFLRAARPD